MAGQVIAHLGREYGFAACRAAKPRCLPANVCRFAARLSGKPRHKVSIRRMLRLEIEQHVQSEVEDGRAISFGVLRIGCARHVDAIYYRWEARAFGCSVAPRFSTFCMDPFERHVLLARREQKRLSRLARHAEDFADRLDCRQSRSDGHFFGDAGEGIMEAPSVPRLEFLHRRLKVIF